VKPGSTNGMQMHIAEAARHTPRGEIISFARLVRSVNRRAGPDGGASCLILIAYAHASGSRTPFLALGPASSFADFAKSDAPIHSRSQQSTGICERFQKTPTALTRAMGCLNMCT
jgi:hypothetical protein